MNAPNGESPCIICGAKTYGLHDPQLDVWYDVCVSCGYTYKRPIYHLDATREKMNYDKHENTMDNEGYVAMFERFLEESVFPYIRSGRALDFGSGPGPVLYELLGRHGFINYHYDPYYHKNPDIYNRSFDLITSTEVFEHLFEPKKVFNQLYYLLEDGAILAVMTSLRPKSDEDFLTWWYRRDPTHIGFFTLKAFEALVRPYRMKMIYTNRTNHFVFRKEFAR